MTLLVPVLAAVALLMFVWPAARMAPHDLPIGVAGPAQATGVLTERLSAVGSGAFEIHQYADEAAARSAIQDREVYGALVAGPSGMTVLTASAASPLVAQLLTQAVTAEAGGAGDAGAMPRIVDVVPTTPDDPRGGVLNASLLPLVLGGLLGGVLLATVTRPGLGQSVALVLVAALVGLAATGIAQGWLDAFRGDWWVNAGVLGLTVLAIGSAVAGLAALFGRVGMGLGAALMMLVGNPFSGVTSAPELLPRWAGITGQLLPPGAGGTLLRSTAFFDGATALRPLTVLCAWTVFGLAAVFLGALWRGRPAAGGS
ncbi:hypothetical protein [Actinopolymorpha alba]|uniref:hypothetical protein n=1 Tax=Actinopolymorpha alba TaxID=533267 RepID=UPI0003778914|nr:hypothetical protein [Actinopolymorpha alba]